MISVGGDSNYLQIKRAFSSGTELLTSFNGEVGIDLMIAIMVAARIMTVPKITDFFIYTPSL